MKSSPDATFRPHPLLRGGHAQTLAGMYLPGGAQPYKARRHEVELDDGDRIVLHDDRPQGWQPGDRTGLLVHGLAGCHFSPYMRRVAGKLTDLGVRAFRMDLRSCGAGVGLARMPYHSGRWADVRAALERIAELAPGSPATAVGFSLGANLVLNLAARHDDGGPANLDSAVAVSPPVELNDCADNLRRRLNRAYDRFFVRLLWRSVQDRARRFPDAPGAELGRRPRSLKEFDDVFTAPVCGFGTADRYYRQCSPRQHLGAIRLPTLILAAADDPLVPAAPLASAEVGPAVRKVITRHGGHLGFVGRANGDPDRRWMDWRIVHWVAAQ